MTSHTKTTSKFYLVLAGVAALALVGGAMFFKTGEGVAESAIEPAAGEPAAAEAPSAQAADAAAAGGEAAGDLKEIKLGNPVVAVVDGKDITRADVFNFISTLPEQVRQMPIQQLFPLAQEQVINNHLISLKAVDAKLDADPEVAKLMTQAKDQIVRNVYVDRELDKEVTQKKLLKAYEEMLAGMKEVEETKASHILVDSEEKAKEIITKLDGGAKFEDLAKENSEGPSGSKGGDLGWFAKSEMVPEFAEAAFAVGKGEHSKTPVKTQFGWHVIKVEDRRMRPEPQFEAVKPQLEVQLRQKSLNEILEKWQKDSKIKKFDINGEPVKETKSN